MKYLMTEEEAIYMQAYQGHFSRKLAAWAISNMEVDEPSTDRKKHITMRSVDDVMEILRTNGVTVSDEYTFDAWYLYHMSIADNTKSLPDDKHRSLYVDETINDPDGTDGDVLACFAAKMCNAGIPIHWEMFI